MKKPVVASVQPLTPYQEDARFARACADFLEGKMRSEMATGIPETVSKEQIVYVLGKSYSRSQVDKKWRKDADFPKPVNEKATRLQWLLYELLLYKRKMSSRQE